MSLKAAALGLGADSGAGAVLGQPLNFVVQLRLAPGETLQPRCVSAQVRLGERALASGAVRTALEFTGPETARVRVLTSLSVDEPVVTVALTAGCRASVTRNFVLFADPPELPYAQVLAAAKAPVAAPSPSLPPAASTSGSTAPEGMVAAATPAQGAAVQARSPAANLDLTPDQAPRTAATARPDRASARQAEEARAQARARRAALAERRRAQRAAAAARRAAEASVAAAVPAPPAGPRLRLDGPEPTPSADAQAVEQALDAVAQATSVARAMAAAASAAEQRIAALESTVEQLRGEARANAQGNAALRARLADTAGADRWIGPLLFALVVLGALAVWLAWRLAELQRLRQAGWREAAAGSRPGSPGDGASARAANAALADPPSRQMTRPIPFVTSEIMPAAPALRPRTAPAWPPPASSGPDTVPGPPAARPSTQQGAASSSGSATAAVPPGPAPSPGREDELPEPAMQRTDVLPAHLRPEHANARDVSIEELIDLEQQAEFFVVLGQDESAIDLLVDHLRNTGGGSPLPYLKLLEIYRRRGDREAYERTRARFNHRFNAYAPDWDADLLHGRSLEEYEGVVPRLQQVWPRPLDAMAELEALLFRKSRGELFELPAYREVLFLYALARDLLDRESLDSGTVDLLLPLSAGLVAAAAGAGAVSPGTLDLDLAPGEGAEAPTAPVDLDLTLAEQRTSIFDPLDDPPTRPHED
jgi:pilus assembly protein FimV